MEPALSHNFESFFIAFFQNDPLPFIKEQIRALSQQVGPEKLQEHYLSKILNNPKLKETSLTFKKQVTSMLLNLIENENKELNEELVNLYLKIATDAKKQSTTYCSKTFFFLDEKRLNSAIPIRLLSSYSQVGMIPWTSGFVLSEFILSN